jgi:nitrate reductase NapE component
MLVPTCVAGASPQIRVSTIKQWRRRLSRPRSGKAVRRNKERRRMKSKFIVIVLVIGAIVTVAAIGLNAYCGYLERGIRDEY